MDWWNDLTDWSASDEGWRVLSGAIIPFVAIVVAGVIAAVIGRAAAKRVVALHDRESRNSAVAGVVSAARKASRWGALGHEERAYADHLAEDADVRLRLLPVSGAPLAADWVQHEIADIKRNSSTFTSQADQSLAELRGKGGGADNRSIHGYGISPGPSFAGGGRAARANRSRVSYQMLSC